MSRNVIKSAGDLQTLPTARRQVTNQAPASTRTGSRGAWLISPPADGNAYTRDEVARLADVSHSTLRSWIRDGIKGVRLQSLRVPRGRIAPPDLCEFLSRVNGLAVEVRR